MTKKLNPRRNIGPRGARISKRKHADSISQDELRARVRRLRPWQQRAVLGMMRDLCDAEAVEVVRE